LPLAGKTNNQENKQNSYSCSFSFGSAHLACVSVLIPKLLSVNSQMKWQCTD